MRELVILLLVNTVFSLVFGIVGGRRKTERRKNLIKMCFMILCPVVGPLYLGISGVVYRLFYRNAIDRSIMSFADQRSSVLRLPEVEEEMNLVPMREALAVSHKLDQRQLLLQVIKNDPDNSLSTVREALASGDSETSHYAASAILDVTSRFEVEAEEALHRLEEDPDNLGYCSHGADVFYRFLIQRVLSPTQQEGYVEEARRVYENMYQRHRKAMGPQRFLEISRLLLDAGAYSEAETWAARARQEHPNALETYQTSLKTYYAMGDREHFLQCVEELKRSDVRIDGATLELIRFLSR